MIVEILIPALKDNQQGVKDFHQFIQRLQEDFNCYYTLGFPQPDKHDKHLLNKYWVVAHGTQEGKWRGLTYDEAAALWLMANMPSFAKIVEA